MNNTETPPDTRSALAKRICDRHYRSIGSIPPLPLWQVIDDETAQLKADNTALIEALSEYLKRDDKARRNAATRSIKARLLNETFGGALPEKARAALARFA